MRLCTLNPAGIGAMHAWLTSTASSGAPVPGELLQVGKYVERARSGRDFEVQQFASRLEWAKFAVDVLGRDVGQDAGIWCWLTLIHFDQVCPLRSDGSRKPGQRARYVPTGSDFRTYYRHLLAGPWRILSAHADDPSRCRGLLAGPLDKPGELYEQIASRMELATSPTVALAVNRLYVDDSKGSLKRGAGGSGKGAPRRLADILMQFDLTFDIYQMPVERLLSLLPKEFERFKKTG